MKQTDIEKRPPGRPRENPDGEGKGNKMLQIRFSPEQLAQIRAKGPGWAKRLILENLEPKKTPPANRGQHHGKAIREDR